MNSEIIAAIVGGGFVIIGVIIGNISVKKTTLSQERIRLLSEFYSEVFTAFTNSAPFTDSEKWLSFIISAEKAKLLCSKESEKILSSLICEVTKDNPSPEIYSELMIKLRDSAKKDLHKH